MDIQKALKELAQQIKNEIIRRMDSDVGINPRTGTNTLTGSELQKSVDVKVVSENELVFEIADYFQYVVTGWKRTGNYPGTAHLFIGNITDWVRRKGVRLGTMTENQIVWYLYRRMLIEGRQIAPRPFINYGETADEVLPFLEDFFNDWADRLFEGLMNEIRLFNK